MTSWGASCSTLAKRVKFTPHAIHNHGNERRLPACQTAVELYCACRLTYTSSETDLSCIPNLRNVDRQALFCTFCSCTQNLSKHHCQGAGNNSGEYFLNLFHDLTVRSRQVNLISIMHTQRPCKTNPTS